MINESERDSLMAYPSDGTAPPSAGDRLGNTLRAAVSDVFLIDDEADLPTRTPSVLTQQIVATYTGHLLIDSEQAYDQIDARLAPLDYLPTFSRVNGRETITILKGRIAPIKGDWRINLGLFIATVLSLLFMGTIIAGADINTAFDLLKGLPYALATIAILGSHELGHYFAARRHKVNVSLPFFLPFPNFPGTFGAFIRLREPVRNKKILLDIGASGPLIGLMVAIPILLYGLKTSPVTPIDTFQLFTLKSSSVSVTQEGNSILYALAKIVVFGHFVPDGMQDVNINQLATAGWVGVLLTGLNLIPIAQLDGGHIIYSLLGERVRILFYPLLIILILLATLYASWAILAVLLVAFGRFYATPLDTITPLNRSRQIVAIIALILFVLSFMPIPFQMYTIGG